MPDATPIPLDRRAVLDAELATGQPINAEATEPDDQAPDDSRPQIMRGLRIRKIHSRPH